MIKAGHQEEATMIRYLADHEKISTRTMYEENFPEDAASFVDFYYQNKTIANKILVMAETEKEKADFQVMLHLNPYRLSFCGSLIKSNYIVAVATAQPFRKKGKMAEVLRQACLDMYRERQAFTFLMPANPLVYLSAGFRFFQQAGQQPGSDLSAASVQRFKNELATELVSEGSLAEAASFVNQQLRQRFSLYIHRDVEYYQQKLAELKSEAGEIVLVKDRGIAVGVFSYGQNKEEIEIQEMIFKEKYDAAKIIKEFFPAQRIHFNNAALMLRILDLHELVKLLRCKKAFRLKVRVTDPWIKENNGCYMIEGNEVEGRIAAIKEAEVDCTMDIAQLGEYFFSRLDSFIQEWV